jgi:ParB/RepB/Spo0J family partition protein
MTVDIDINRVFLRPDHRKEDVAGVARLVDSIREIGIINPLRVRPARYDGSGYGFKGDAFEVTAGAHRLRAARQLGMTSVPCLLVDDDDLRAELAMLDENLCRSDLGTGDRDKALARRKAIYLELHPETAAGKSQAAGMNAALGHNVETRNVPTFVAATAKAIERSESFVKQAVERGEKVVQEAVDLLRGTSRDKPRYYVTLKGLPPEEQIERVRRDLARDAKVEKNPPRGPKPYLRRRRRSPKPQYSCPSDTQDDRDLRALLGFWNSATEVARKEFLRTIAAAQEVKEIILAGGVQQ